MEINSNENDFTEQRIGDFAFRYFPKLKFIVKQLIIAHPFSCGFADLLVKSAGRRLKQGQT